MTDRGYRRGIPLLLFSLLSLLLPLFSLAAQTEGDPVEMEEEMTIDTVDVDTVEIDEWEDEWEEDDWEDVPVTTPDPAPAPGGFGLYGGPTFETFRLATASLDPDLDQDLILFGGYGFVVVSHIILGGGGAGTTLEQPNEAYDRFSYSFGGFLTGYDLLLSDNLSLRATLLVGSGEIEMVKTRNDLSGLGPNQFLERFRQEEFFLLRPAASIGYTLLGFIDLRADAARLLPIGGEDASELGEWTFGLHLYFGFRNSVSVN